MIRRDDSLADRLLLGGAPSLPLRDAPLLGAEAEAVELPALPALPASSQLQSSWADSGSLSAPAA